MRLVRTRPNPIYRTAAAVLQRWLALVLVWLTRLNIQRTPEQLKRTEKRLKQLIVARAFAQQPKIFFRYTGGKRVRGSWQRRLMRGLIPALTRFQFNRAARILHVGRHLDAYVRKFLQRLARGLLGTRTIKRRLPPLRGEGVAQRATGGVRCAVDTS